MDGIPRARHMKQQIRIGSTYGPRGPLPCQTLRISRYILWRSGNLRVGSEAVKARDSGYLLAGMYLPF